MFAYGVTRAGGDDILARLCGGYANLNGAEGGTSRIWPRRPNSGEEDRGIMALRSSESLDVSFRDCWIKIRQPLTTPIISCS